MCEQITLHYILTCPIIHSSTMFIKVLTILLNVSLFLTIKLVTSTNMASNRKEAEIPSTYNCLQCSSKFKQKFNLTKHIKSVHTQDEFKCDQCARLLACSLTRSLACLLARSLAVFESMN